MQGEVDDGVAWAGQRRLRTFLEVTSPPSLALPCGSVDRIKDLRPGQTLLAGLDKRRQLPPTQSPLHPRRYSAAYIKRCVSSPALQLQISMSATGYGHLACSRLSRVAVSMPKLVVMRHLGDAWLPASSLICLLTRPAKLPNSW